MVATVITSASNGSSVRNGVFSVCLIVLCIVSYILLLLLFIKPSLYHIESLIYVDRPSKITPAVAIGLIAALLAGATSAFTTRCVEQSLWLRLVPRDVKQPLTVGETNRLAQWTVSPLERVKYILFGQSWLLKLSGPLLLATAITAPVLLAGVSQTSLVDVVRSTEPHTEGVWTPYINLANRVSRGGSAKDLVFNIALEASLNNFSAPVAPVCDQEACRVTTRSAALFATCTPRTLDNPRGMGLTVCSDRRSVGATDYCSELVPSLCANLTCGAPSVFANFVASRDKSCFAAEGGSIPSGCGTVAGAWGTVFGVWVGGADLGMGDTSIINTVDCEILYGNVSITQTGSQSPLLDRDSFERSEYLLSDYAEPISNVRTFTWADNVKNNAFSFTLRVVGTGWNDLYLNTIAYGLLGYDAVNSAESTARRIEGAFDFATLGAFARTPSASDMVVTLQSDTRMYVYNKLVLLILLVPLIATIAGTWGRWMVGSDDDVLGYSPLAIASRGPVYGLLPTAFTTDPKYRKQCENMKVKGYPDATGSGQEGVIRAGLYVES